MDEILIEEKKYVSSKRAAKITGYAKDYVGQLCREGRVPARLVGRSWYVLESAIHDHRFGNPEPTSTPLKDVSQKSIASWEPPRYEVSQLDILPSINRLQSSETPIPAPLPKEEESQHLHDSWKTWFDRVSDTESAPAVAHVPEKQQEEILETEEEIDIPIKTIYELPPEDLLPRHPQTDTQEEIEPQERREKPRMEGRAILRGVRITGALAAISFVMLSVIGSGYFDEYVISNNQAGLLAGVSVYNR